jgi:hypothetical protein
MARSVMMLSDSIIPSQVTRVPNLRPTVPSHAIVMPLPPLWDAWMVARSTVPAKAPPNTLFFLPRPFLQLCAIPGGMIPLMFLRSLTLDERQQLAPRLRSHHTLTVRRCQHSPCQGTR